MQRLVIIVLGTAAVKLAHKSEGSRHKILSDFHEIKSVQRSRQQFSACGVPTEYTRICILHFESGI